MHYKNILFDLDNTILDFTSSERGALTEALSSFGIKADDEMLLRYSVINDYHWKLLEQGKISRQEVLTHRFTQFLAEYGIDIADRLMKEAYESRLSRQYFLVPGAMDMLSCLYGVYRLYAVSNGTASVQHGRMGGAGLGHFFDDVFISEEIGFEKPDARFFYSAFARIDDFKKSETLIVGDSLSSDIQGGINVGITTVWFNPERKPADKKTDPDHTLYGWDGLYQILS